YGVMRDGVVSGIAGIGGVVEIRVEGPAMGQARRQKIDSDRRAIGLAEPDYREGRGSRADAGDVTQVVNGKDVCISTGIGDLTGGCEIDRVRYSRELANNCRLFEAKLDERAAGR